MSRTQEVLFVGLPGPTHNYGGLSPDNVASSLHKGSVSRPKEAALQAIELMRALKAMGLEVAVLPPQLRPDIALLQTTFSGSPEEVIKAAAARDRLLLHQAYSSSAMWAANAATVAPGVDTLDHKLHITTANLHTNLHRRIEAKDTHRVLCAIFEGMKDAAVHAPLPAGEGFRDEGAANHMRLAPRHGEQGLHVFVVGADGSLCDPPTARQTLCASQKIAQIHQLLPEHVLFVKQNPEIIAQGVFHNDVIAVNNESVLLIHEKAFAGDAVDIARIRDAYRRLNPGKEPTVIEIQDKDLSVAEAVKTYFFNSQLVTKPDGHMAFIAPKEVEEHPKARALMEKIRADTGNPINEIRYLDLRQSMQNGGGPACLRLRVPMTQAQIAAARIRTQLFMDDERLVRLEQWVRTHYPDELTLEELGDPALYYRYKNLKTNIFFADA